MSFVVDISIKHCFAVSVRTVTTPSFLRKLLNPAVTFWQIKHFPSPYPIYIKADGLLCFLFMARNVIFPMVVKAAPCPGQSRHLCRDDPAGSVILPSAA